MGALVSAQVGAIMSREDFFKRVGTINRGDQGGLAGRRLFQGHQSRPGYKIGARALRWAADEAGWCLDAHAWPSRFLRPLDTDLFLLGSVRSRRVTPLGNRMAPARFFERAGSKRIISGPLTTYHLGAEVGGINPHAAKR